jgi:hypothetical protein
MLGYSLLLTVLLLFLTHGAIPTPGEKPAATGVSHHVYNFHDPDALTFAKGEGPDDGNPTNCSCVCPNAPPSGPSKCPNGDTCRPGSLCKP